MLLLLLRGLLRRCRQLALSKLWPNSNCWPSSKWLLLLLLLPGLHWQRSPRGPGLL